MAVLHPATLRPTKLEALQAWVPSQPWLDGADTSQLELLGAYRFDDPADEVGLEAHLLATADGRVLHVPVTYRGAPPDGADAALITTMEHSVLGQRWVYDGCADPVFLAAYRAAITTGGRQADQFVATDAGLVPREATVRVRGTGADSGAGDGGTADRGGELTVLRFPRPGQEPLALTGTWAGQDTPLLLAVISA